MKNEEKFKDPSERQDAFEKYCKASIKECDGDEPCGQCQHYNFSNRTTCILNWLSDEYKDPDLPFRLDYSNFGKIHIVIDHPEYGYWIVKSRERDMEDFLQRFCAQLNAAALAWHKRMVEKESE